MPEAERGVGARSPVLSSFPPVAVQDGDHALTEDQNWRAASWLGWEELRDLLSLALRGHFL